MNEALFPPDYQVGDIAGTHATAQVVSFLLFSSLADLSASAIEETTKRAHAGSTLRAQSVAWSVWLEKASMLLTTPTGLLAQSYLRYDFEHSERKSNSHPYVGAQLLSTQHLLSATREVDDMEYSDPSRAAVAFDCLRLDSGLPLSDDLVLINKAFELAYQDMPLLLEIYANMLNSFNRASPLGFHGFKQAPVFTVRSHQDLVADYYAENFEQIKLLMQTELPSQPT